MNKIVIFLLFFTTSIFAQNNPVSEPHRSVPVEPGKGQTDPDLEIARKRIVADLFEPAIQEKDIKKLVDTQKTDGTWPDINYGDVSKTGFQHSDHLRNMLELGRAFKKDGSGFRGNQGVKVAFSKALDFWLDHDFICENWWWNEMGTPHLMINILLVMDADLTERQHKEGIRIAGRANLEASGARPGGDLIQIAGLRGKQALFQRNAEVLAQVVAVMASEIKVSTGRGLKPDLSFHHRTDNVISTLAYGTGYASAFAYWSVKIAGTKYTFPEPAMRLLVDYFLDGICPALVYGRYPDPGAENRGITRKGALNPAGPELAENLLASTSYRKAELENIARIRKGEIKPNLTRDSYFWHSHYYSHQRPGYFASVRMHSDRANNMEQPHNEEGIQNHHYGDGSNFISVTGKEYDQIFPVWDWRKIPGTTVVQDPTPLDFKNLAKKGLTDFAGGVTDGRYGAAAFDFSSVHDPLKARKSWFFFDKEFVNLGAGISSDAEYPVATTLNQCLLNTEVLVRSYAKTAPLKAGKHRLNSVEWVLQDGVAYIFPSPAAVSINDTVATGNWRQINHQAWATTEEVKEHVFTLWLNHGSRPKDAAYQYIVVPGIKASEIEAYNKKSDIRILANTPDLQAVQHKGLGITQIVFYKPGKITVNNELTLTVEKPCIVLISANEGRVKKIAVSDPTTKLKSIQLGVTSRVKSSGKNWSADWNEGRKSSTVKFDFPQDGMAGQTVVADLNE